MSKSETNLNIKNGKFKTIWIPAFAGMTRKSAKSGRRMRRPYK